MTRQLIFETIQSAGLEPSETEMAVVGYARVSSVGQSLEVQRDLLLAAGCEEIFEEKKSGATKGGREALEAAMRYVRNGDVLVVCRLDRLARSIVDLRSIVDDLTNRAVGFRCLQQQVDTTSSEGRLLLNILASFAEFETDIRRERQRDGIEKAKANGKYKGRPASVDRAALRNLAAEGLGATAIARRLGIGRASVYRLLKE